MKSWKWGTRDVEVDKYIFRSESTGEKYKLWARIKVKDGYQEEIAGLLVLVHFRSHKFSLRRIYRGDQVHIFKYFPSVSLFDSLRRRKKETLEKHWILANPAKVIRSLRPSLPKLSNSAILSNRGDHSYSQTVV